MLNVRQRLQFQVRMIVTEHGNPDFERLAERFGAKGLRIAASRDVNPVLEEALSATGPVVVDVVVDPEDLPTMNLEANLRMSAVV